MSRKAFHLMALGLISLALASTSAFAENPILLRFSYVTTADTPKGKGAERFKELAEKATKGRVRVEVYPDSTLYKDKEELEALQLGAVEMLAPSLAKFGPLGIKEFEAFDIPYLFPSKEVMVRVTEGPVGKSLLRKLEPKGIVGLAYWNNGFKQMTANRPLRTPADFKGLKMRIQSSRVIDAQFRTLGANPQVLAFSEVHQTLKANIMDGAENTASNIYTQKIHEVQKHLTVSDHAYLGYAVIVNKKFWDGLPGDVRSQLEGAMKEATQYTNSIADAENAEALDKIRKSGKITVHVLSERERAEWRRALLPVRKAVEARVGKDVLRAVDKESAALGFK